MYLYLTFYSFRDVYKRQSLIREIIMKLLNTYDDKETAEIFFERIEGEKRLASERDATRCV